MKRRRVFKIAATALAGAAAVGGATWLYQVRRPPVTNSYYVSLGSSYAAGLGLGPLAPNSPIVSQRSTNGYPQQLARRLKVPSFTDMTSSGATTRHVLRGGQMLLGPQVEALGPDTRLVTVTAGGNDVAYVGDITMMALKGRKDIMGALAAAFWNGAKPLNRRGFAELGTEFDALLAEIKRRSPSARIVVVTYPIIIPSKGSCAKLGLTEDQAQLMRAVGEKLAEVTRISAKEAGATLVDMAVRSIGHDVCGAEPWVNGRRPATGAEFHPTLAGARATAEAISNAIRVSGTWPALPSERWIGPSQAVQGRGAA